MIYVYNKRTLSFKPVIRRLFFFSIVTSIACIISAYAYGYFKGFDTGASTITDIERSIFIKESDKFSEEKLKEYLLQLNIKFPHIVYAQAVLETGNFKSRVFQNNQNLFGMKQARVRATTNQGTELGHAVYNHWRESVVDYALFQCAFLLKVRTEEGYYQYLSENYAENPDYVSKIKTLAEKFKTRTK